MKRRRRIMWMGRRRMLALFAASVAVGAQLLAASVAHACDTEILRVQAQQDVPDYRVDAVKAERGNVTLLFTAPDGTRTFAVALQAKSKQLSTSVTGSNVDSAELARASQPLTMWWKRPELQQALVACCQSTPDGTEMDVVAAAEAALPTHAAGAARELPAFGGLRAQWQSVEKSWLGLGAVVLLVLAGVVVGLRRARR